MEDKYLEKFYTLFPDRPEAVEQLYKVTGKYQWRAKTLILGILRGRPDQCSNSIKLARHMKNHIFNWKTDYWVVLHLKRILSIVKNKWINDLKTPKNTPPAYLPMDPQFDWTIAPEICGDNMAEKSFYLMMRGLNSKNKDEKEILLQKAMYEDFSNNEAFVYWVREQKTEMIKGGEFALIGILDGIWDELGDFCPSAVVIEAQDILVAKHNNVELISTWKKRRKLIG